MALLITRRGSGLVPVLLAAVAATSCATMSPSSLGRTEVRGDLLLHSDPNFRFQIAPGWRIATPADWTSFGANQRVLGRMNDYGRQQFVAAGAAEFRRYPFVLISARGAWINGSIGANNGVRYRSGYVLNEPEKKALWDSIEAEVLKNAVPTDRPRLALKSMDIRDYGSNTVLVLRLQREDQRGSFLWTAFAFFGEHHLVTLEHCGISDDPDEGVSGLEAMAASFRFD